MTSAERVERMSLLKRQAELLRDSADKQRYLGVLHEMARLKRIEDGFNDIMVFAKTYFVNGGAPHDLLKPGTPSPPFHFELASRLREAMMDPNERKIAMAAPRSHAKSTIVTNIFVLWQVCYADDVQSRYIVIISDKQDGSRRQLDVIKTELESNPLLIADFGNLKGATWNSLEVITPNNCKLQAAGAGEALRGLRFGSFRPSCIVLDDIESDESCSTPDRVQKMDDWLSRTVLPLGDPKTSKFFLVGTVISYASVLNTILTHRAEWEAYKYRAIETFPERMDMWKTFEEMYHDRSEGNDAPEAARIARRKALSYYTDNIDAMDAGAKVLWPERMDLLSLMEKRTTARLAFNSEFQNQPIDQDTRIFHTIRYYDPEDANLRDLEIYGAVDPSLGGSKRSDPSAIVTVGKHKRSGVVYVLDVDVKRRSPDQIIQDMFVKARTYDYVTFSVESVAFQQFFASEVQKRSAEQGVYLPVKEWKSTVKKEIRIASIEPLVTSGYIRFLSTQRDLIEEMEYFPKAAHDDSLDCLAQVMELVKRRGAGLTFGKI